MSPRGSTAAVPGSTAANVAASVRAATEALSQLHLSLERGGFAEGAAAYERMAELLLTQRLWVESEGVALQAEFESLGDIARRAYALLEPYTTAMKRLAVLAPSGDEVARRRLMDVLSRRGARGASKSTLRRELRIDRPDVDRLLGPLVEEGVVTVRGSGGAALYSLAPSRQGRPARTPRRGDDAGGPAT